jgi:hypothetical protein
MCKIKRVVISSVGEDVDGMKYSYIAGSRGKT